MNDQATPTIPSDALAADDLGAAAEFLFANLCTRARLTPNKSDRDRSGWDFVVDFPLARFAADWRTLLDMAGIRSVGQLTMDDLWEGSRAGLAADMIHPDNVRQMDPAELEGDPKGLLS